MREVQWMQWFAEAGPADEAARTGDAAPAVSYTHLVIRRENKTKPRKKKAALDDDKDG